MLGVRRRSDYGSCLLLRPDGRIRVAALLLLAETHVGGEVFGFSRALRIRMLGEVVIHRVAKVLAALPRERRNFEDGTVPFETLQERSHARLAIFFGHHVEL